MLDILISIFTEEPTLGREELLFQVKLELDDTQFCPLWIVSYPSIKLAMHLYIYSCICMMVSNLSIMPTSADIYGWI